MASDHFFRDRDVFSWKTWHRTIFLPFSQRLCRSQFVQLREASAHQFGWVFLVFPNFFQNWWADASLRRVRFPNLYFVQLRPAFPMHLHLLLHLPWKQFCIPAILFLYYLARCSCIILQCKNYASLPQLHDKNICVGLRWFSHLLVTGSCIWWLAPKTWHSHSQVEFKTCIHIAKRIKESKIKIYEFKC